MTPGECPDIPPFLRRRATGGKKVKARARQVEEPVAAETPSEQTVERVQITEFVRLAETPFEEAGFAYDSGVIPRRWYENESEDRQERRVAKLHLALAAKQVKVEEKVEREAKPKRMDRYAGLVRLDEIILAMKPVPELDVARRAVRAGKFETVSGMKGLWLKPADIDAARQAIRDYKSGGVVVREGRRMVGVVVVDSKGVIELSFARFKNPHRPGTTQHDRMEVLMKHKGKTVREFLDAGGDASKLKHALAQEWVKIREAK